MVESHRCSVFSIVTVSDNEVDLECVICHKVIEGVTDPNENPKDNQYYSNINLERWK